MTNKFYQKKQTSEKKHAKDIKISKTQRKTPKRRQTTNSAKLNSIFEWFRYKARVKTTKTKKKEFQKWNQKQDTTGKWTLITPSQWNMMCKITKEVIKFELDTKKFEKDIMMHFWKSCQVKEQKSN